MLGQYESEKFGTFSVIRRDRERKALLLKFDRTGSLRWYTIKSFRAGKVIDLRQPWLCGVGFNDYGREESYYQHLRLFWYDMIKRCHDRKTHTMVEEWHDFGKFYEFVNREDQKDLHVAITEGFLVTARYHHYSPTTMIVMPNLITDQWHTMKWEETVTVHQSMGSNTKVSKIHDLYLY